MLSYCNIWGWFSGMLQEYDHIIYKWQFYLLFPNIYTSNFLVLFNNIGQDLQNKVCPLSPLVDILLLCPI